jgi:hypothetical protein
VDAEQKQPEPQLTYPEAELVLGLVYAAGTDYTGIQLSLENYIKRFNYKPNPIRLSDFIDKILQKINGCYANHPHAPPPVSKYLREPAHSCRGVHVGTAEVALTNTILRRLGNSSNMPCITL